jgi:hypothetical protein
MSPRVNGTFGPMELNRVGQASPTLPKAVGDWRALVGQAIGRAGFSHKEIAATLDITQSAFSKQLSGLEHLSFWRMFSLPPEFWQEMVTLICEFHGLQIGMTQQDQEDMAAGRAFREAVQRVRAR